MEVAIPVYLQVLGEEHGGVLVVAVLRLDGFPEGNGGDNVVLIEMGCGNTVLQLKLDLRQQGPDPMSCTPPAKIRLHCPRS